MCWDLSAMLFLALFFNLKEKRLFLKPDTTSFLLRTLPIIFPGVRLIILCLGLSQKRVCPYRDANCPAWLVGHRSHHPIAGAVDCRQGWIAQERRPKENSVNQSTSLPTVSTTMAGDNWSSDKLISRVGAASFTMRREMERTPDFHSSTRLSSSDYSWSEPLVIEGPHRKHASRMRQEEGMTKSCNRKDVIAYSGAMTWLSAALIIVRHSIPENLRRVMRVLDLIESLIKNARKMSYVYDWILNLSEL